MGIYLPFGILYICLNLISRYLHHKNVCKILSSVCLDVKPIPITAEGESNTKLIIIVASCAGGFLLVFLIFIQICLKTRRGNTYMVKSRIIFLVKNCCAPQFLENVTMKSI